MYNLSIENINELKLNCISYVFLSIYYYCMEHIGKALSYITPTWKMRKLFLFFTHDVGTKFYRKRRLLQAIYINQKAKCWYCNCCGNLVIKGNIGKGGVVLNCPHCGSVYTIYPDSRNKLGRSTVLCNNRKYMHSVKENTIIDTGIRGYENLLGKKYKINEFGG